MAATVPSGVSDRRKRMQQMRATPDTRISVQGSCSTDQLFGTRQIDFRRVLS